MKEEICEVSMSTVMVTLDAVDGGYKLVASKGMEKKEAYASTIRKAAMKAGQLVQSLLEQGYAR